VCVRVCVCWTVNGEPWLRPECSEVQQLRAELVTMRDNVERLINRLQLMTSFTATSASATVANDNDTAASDGQYPSNGQLPSNCDVALCHILHTHTQLFNGHLSGTTWVGQWSLSEPKTRVDPVFTLMAYDWRISCDLWCIYVWSDCVLYVLSLS